MGNDPVRIKVVRIDLSSLTIAEIGETQSGRLHEQSPMVSTAVLESNVEF